MFDVYVNRLAVIHNDVMILN